MSILDDAIREHLELKRQHGADEAELKRLEDEAFGPPGRPEEESPFAEAPTEFMATSEASAGDGEEGGRRVNIADLQEPPPPDQRIREQGDVSPVAPAEDAAQVAPPAEEEPLELEEPAAMEHEVIAEEPSAPLAEELEEGQPVAEQPTELFDVEAQIASEEPPAAEVPSPSDEEIADAEASEPKLAPIEPATEIYASRAEIAEPEIAEPEVEEDEDEFDEFFSDQRLSEELDQALEAPLTDEHEIPAPPAAETSAPLTDEQDEGEDEGEYDDEEVDETETESGHEDVLEDTPDFLEDAPEDDELWFEQRPPKDFDFDD
ncbi:MAG TPA: hypothetical protein VFI17_04650 [Solirubrobacterales bacterium]|nr:hypothetical protein [Solirubrobacterales bacterium]